MKRRWTDFKSPLAGTIKAFLAHKRALGHSFWTEEAALRLIRSLSRRPGDCNH